MNTKLLRQKILDLAIRGKLVPQDKSEGDAKDLLNEIKNEKAKLIKEGKIKKEKPLPEITDDEKPFEIPESWCWCRFGDIFWHNTGKTQNSSVEIKNGILRKFITTSNLYWNKFDFTKVKEMLFSEKEFDRCTVTKGDLLICEGGECGRSAIWQYDYDVCFQNHVHRARVIKANTLYVKFYYYLTYYYKNIGLIEGRGVGIKSLSTENLHKLLIPLPPLAEQKRIVDKIDELFALIDHIEREKLDLQNLTKTARQKILDLAIRGKLVSQDTSDEPAGELITKIQAEQAELIKQGKLKKDKNQSYIFKADDGSYYEKIGNNEPAKLIDLPFEIPEGWVWVSILQIADIYTGNSINEVEKRNKYLNIPQGINYIATKDVSFNGVVNYENGVKIPFDEMNNFRVAPAFSTLLCIEGGSAGRKVGFIEEDICFVNKLCCFHSDYIDNYYLYGYIKSPIFISLFNDFRSGLIGGVSLNQIKTIRIPLPPLAEQKRIVAKINELFAQIDIIEESLKDEV